MNTEQMLKKYLSEHPDYWEYENELQEVRRLKALCENDNADKYNFHSAHYCSELRLCI
ncbi:MAG: hypothetical protein JXA77_08580 [Bacteroidales bacterium]|nr:hypothetical protein [Bacteroidales bacterium]MBN2820986.1 hypothetical protein [Bacteroidales bacterium]